MLSQKSLFCKLRKQIYGLQRFRGINNMFSKIIFNKNINLNIDISLSKKWLLLTFKNIEQCL